MEIKYLINSSGRKLKNISGAFLYLGGHIPDRLATPIIKATQGPNISFGAVEHAQTYKVFVNNVFIGECIPEEDVNNLLLANGDIFTTNNDEDFIIKES